MAKIRIDGTRTQTLRTILLASIAGVGVVVLGALGLRQLAQHGIHLDLPGQLGVNISQTANGFTYSQSQGGHTIFTIHASKIVEYKGDQAELHDVQIVLYGPPGSNRRDRISGGDFLYNRSTGVVTAKGAVQIDMASPAATKPGAPGAKPSAPLPDTIHIETSALVFNQKTGDATTAAPLAFTLPRATGKSIGGDYNAKTGVLVLQSQVELHTDENGSPAVVYASHAQMLRDSHVAYLLKARDEYQGSLSSADQAILHFREDGSLQHLDAQDNVHGVTAEGAEIFASTATGDFDEQGQPLLMTAGGGVNFVSTNDNSNMHGNAVEGTMMFTRGADGKAMLHHAQFRNAVSFVLQQDTLGGDQRGSAVREITASTVDIDFVPGPDGKAIAKTAIGRGGAHVNLHDIPYNAPPRHTSIAGQQLIAQLAMGHELRQVDGSGGTTVVHYKQDGSTATSHGDTLHATFLPVGQAKEVANFDQKASTGAAGADESARLDTAMQQGRVTMVSQPAKDAKAGDGTPEQPLYATAATAIYHSSDETLHLAGTANLPPMVHNDTVSLTATTIDYNRDTQVALVNGDVRATVLPQKGQTPGIGGSGPSHVVAASGHLDTQANTATFWGVKGTPARLWQGGNSVQAPVLELAKQGKSLAAHAGDSHEAGTVHTVLMQATQGKAPQPMRVASDTLFYSDTTRMGDFKGGVVAQQPSGTVHADDAQVFLSEEQSDPEKAAGRSGSPSKTVRSENSSVERMVATGHVVLTQPGRKGTGSRLVYTGADGHYLLTGEPGALPRVTDSEHGATTGEALLLRSGDNTVEVLDANADGASHRTVTDTRTPK